MYIQRLERRLNFSAPAFQSTFFPTLNARDVLSADVNGDDVKDLVTLSTNGIEIRNGLGDNQYSSPTTIPLTRSAAMTFAKASLTHEPELIVAGFTGNTATLYHLVGNTLSSFRTLSPAATASVQGVSFDDINRDGAVDVMLRYSTSNVNKIREYVNDGDGKFIVKPELAGLWYYKPLLDFDGDGDLDLLGRSETNVYVYLRGEDENLAAPQYLIVRPNYTIQDFAAGDVDRDGDFDIVLVERPNSVGSSLLDTFKQSAGIFTAGPSQSLNNATSVLLADVTTDGILDAVLGTGSGLQVMNGTGNGQFVTSRQLAAGQGARDGRLITLDNGTAAYAWVLSSGVSILPATAGGISSAYVTSEYYTQITGTFDYDLDGFEDAFGFDYAGRVMVLRNSHGRLAPAMAFETSLYVYSVFLADFTGDGVKDLVSTHHQVNNVTGLRVYRATGNTFTFDRMLEVPGHASLGTIIGDWDADGDTDLASMPFNSDVQLLMNNGQGVFAPGPVIDLGAAIRVHVKFCAGDFNRDGIDDIAVTTNSDLRYALGGNGLTQSPVYPLSATVNSLGYAGAGADLSLLISTTTGLLVADDYDGSSPKMRAVMSGNVRSAQAADFDLDGQWTLVARFSPTEYESVPVIIERATGGGFAEPIYLAIGGSLGSFAVTDIDHDADADVVCLSSDYLSPSLRTCYVTYVCNSRLSDTTAPTVSVEANYDVGGRIELSLIFSEGVTESFTISDVSMVNATTGQVITLYLWGLGFNAYNRTIARMFLTPAIPEGRYLFRVAAGSVSDAAGNTLEQTYELPVYHLQGDLTHDGRINFDDLLVLAQNYGKTNQSYSQGNVNRSNGGLVNFDDLLILAQRYGASVLDSAPRLVATRTATRTPSRQTALRELW